MNDTDDFRKQTLALLDELKELVKVREWDSLDSSFKCNG